MLSPHEFCAGAGKVRFISLCSPAFIQFLCVRMNRVDKQRNQLCPEDMVAFRNNSITMRFPFDSGCCVYEPCGVADID